MTPTHQHTVSHTCKNPARSRGLRFELICAATAALASLAGCTLAELDEIDEIDEIVDNLRLAGFPDSEIAIQEDGTVMVGGDAEVSLQASREMIHRDHGKLGEESDKHYRTYNTIDPAVANICVNGAAFTGGLSTALDNALANYNARALSFQFTRTSGATAGCDAVITGYLTSGTGGSAGFPAGGMPYSVFYIGTGIEPNYGVAAATHVITHELGHCIGFRHTDYYNRSISCGSGGNEGEAGVGAVHIPNTPTGAVFNGSVMNSCYNTGSTGQWTSGDLTALEELYGTTNDWSVSLWVADFSNGQGWSGSASYYATIQFPDVNGDGKDDVCGRGVDGIYCVPSTGSAFAGITLWTSAFSNGAGWSGESYYATIRFPDVNGDGKDDVCGRDPDGIRCALSNGTSFDASSLFSTNYSDAAGWNSGEFYWGTIEFPDVNGDGKADVCGRGGNGIICALSTGSAFSTPTLFTSSFSNAAGWAGHESHWGTVEFPDVNGDGKADVCGRAGYGINCGLSTGTSFESATNWTGDYNNSPWIDAESYWGTIQFPDVNADGKADVCGRGPSGVQCNVSTGSAFGAGSVWSGTFSDGNGWGGQAYYWDTITYADVNDDGRADVCGRGAAGVSCALSSGVTFGATSVRAGAYSDAAGWSSSESYWSTIQFPDVDGDGRADVCGRGAAGVHCGI